MPKDDTLDTTHWLAALGRVWTTPRRDDIPLCYPPHAEEVELIYVNPGTNPPTYRIRGHIYRDCAGPVPRDKITVKYQSSSCRVNKDIDLNRVSITDFTPLCPGQQSVCQNSSSSTIGWEEHVYESSNIQLQACTDWVISTTDCCRNSSITTGSANEDFYLYIQVNTQAAPCNNSPRYSNRPAALLCNNQSFCFNPGVSDPDGDNLVFSLTNCRTTDVNTTITYNNSCNGTCSGTNPLPASSGTSINSTNGTVCLQPNNTAVGPVCLLIEEYRGGTKIDEYLRDMQIQVQNCSGNPPQASAINGTLFTEPYNPNNPGTYTYVACVNQNFCFTINFRDPDNQNVTVLPPTGLPTGAPGMLQVTAPLTLQASSVGPPLPPAPITSTPAPSNAKIPTATPSGWSLPPHLSPYPSLTSAGLIIL